MDEWKKIWYVCIDNWCGPGNCYAKWNKLDGERQMPYNCTHMWNLNKKQTHKINTE